MARTSKINDQQSVGLIDDTAVAHFLWNETVSDGELARLLLRLVGQNGLEEIFEEHPF